MSGDFNQACNGVSARHVRRSAVERTSRLGVSHSWFTRGGHYPRRRTNSAAPTTAGNAPGRRGSPAMCLAAQLTHGTRRAVSQKFRTLAESSRI